jgi:hypothetical protein
MSKQSYLLIILFLCIIAYVITGQFRLATESASHLLAREVVRKIELRISEVSKQLKRRPNAGQEFTTLVLDHLNLQNYRQEIRISNVIGGSKNSPAMFKVTIAGATLTSPVILNMYYYGSEYRADLSLKGRLIRQ